MEERLKIYNSNLEKSKVKKIILGSIIQLLKKITSFLFLCFLCIIERQGLHLNRIVPIK